MNRLNPMQIMQMMNNPKNFAKQMFNNSQAMQNPILKNAIGLVDKGDASGLEQLARNICKEKGINADEAFEQIKNNMGI